ncbi:hypothetical protein PSCICJ_26680 [Pseudomonas cichorii]|nr:hypothetical protein PSCICJ_26680 [Pseudomonas cichorii]
MSIFTPIGEAGRRFYALDDDDGVRNVGRNIANHRSRELWLFLAGVATTVKENEQ